jgi:hypothetical protein
MANGDGLARPFSEWLMFGKVTPNLAANFSWVSPVRYRSDRYLNETGFISRSPAIDKDFLFRDENI